jgi:SAM-dependent methyltransferase
MKEHAPSAERNRDEIFTALREALPDEGLVLELASGSGQHAVHFAERLPGVSWQPTDRDTKAIASIRAWAEEAALPNLRDPIELDATQTTWPIESADAIVNINMIHISPWETCEGLLAGARRTLRPGAPLFYYGAFFRRDRETAPSNLEFDRSLRGRDPRWGVRQLEDVLALADTHGLQFDRVLDMPNHNYSLILRQP